MELYPILNKITQQQIDAYSSYLYGCSLKSCGKYSGALMMFGKASAQDPTNPHYPLAEAEMHLKASDLPAAEACLNKSLAIGPTAEGRWIAAFLAAADSRIEEALQKAETAFAEDDRPTLKCYAYSALLSKLGRHKEAQEQIDRLIEQEPDFWEYQVHKADCYLASEEFNKAEECMNLAMDLCCADQSLYAKRAEIREKNGEPESASQDWMDAIRLAPERTDFIDSFLHVLHRLPPDEMLLANLSELIQIDSKNPALYYERAKLYRKLGKTEDAVMDIDRAISWYGSNPEYLNFKSLCYFELGMYEAADRCNTLARMKKDCRNPNAADNKNNPAYLYNASIIREKREQYREAISLIDRAIEVSPQPIYYEQKTELQLAQHLFSEAVRCASDMIGLDPTNARGYILRSRAYEGLRKYADAVADGLQAAQIEPDNTKAIYRKAEVLIASDRNEEAKQTLTAAIDRKLFSAELIRLLFDLLIQENNTREVIRLSEFFLSDDLSSEQHTVTIPEKPYLYFQQFRAYALENSEEEALGALAAAEAASDDPTELLLARAQYRFQLGHYEESLSDCEKLSQSDPTSAILHCMCSMRLQKLGRFDEAQTEAETALKLDPTEAMYHKNIAYVLIAKGDSSLANAALEGAIRINPKDGELHFLHYLILTDLGLPTQAHVSYQTAMRLGYVPGE